MSVKNLTQKITGAARIMAPSALYQLHVNNKLFSSTPFTNMA
jgi:hypothetical protein